MYTTYYSSYYFGEYLSTYIVLQTKLLTRSTFLASSSENVLWRIFVQLSTIIKFLTNVCLWNSSLISLIMHGFLLCMGSYHRSIVKTFINMHLWSLEYIWIYLSFFASEIIDTKLTTFKLWITFTTTLTALYLILGGLCTTSSLISWKELYFWVFFPLSMKTYLYYKDRSSMI